MDDVALPPSATLPGVTDAERARTFTDWMRAHGPALRRVASSYAHAPAEQEDLLQQIALALWQALPGFRGECSARTFVYRVAHNQGAHFATRERLRRPHPDGDFALDALADERPDPERALDARRRQGRLFEAIRALPVSHRQVITLALEDLPHDEIAAVLGITVNNVNVRLSRAREPTPSITPPATCAGRDGSPGASRRSGEWSRRPLASAVRALSCASAGRLADLGAALRTTSWASAGRLPPKALHSKTPHAIRSATADARTPKRRGVLPANVPRGASEWRVFM